MCSLTATGRHEHLVNVFYFTITYNISLDIKPIKTFKVFII